MGENHQRGTPEMPSRILVVDDEPDLELLIRQKFRRKIRDKEFEFVVAYNGLEALNRLEEDGDIDLILTDINMPQMDGLTLLERIRELGKPFLKSVVVSAYGDMDNIRTAMNRGAFDFVTKPINLEDLELTIGKTLQEIAVLKAALATRDKLNAIQQELDIARTIQLTILPKGLPANGEKARFELDAAIESAREVGGDLYDYFFIDDDHLGFVIGDVTGKGVPAALLMAVTKTAIQSTGLRGGSASTCLEAVNNTIVRESPDDMFVTAFYGILDLRTGEVDYCNAGHNFPFRITGKGEVAELAAVSGVPLGFLPDFGYSRHTLRLQPGEALYLCTDGVSEAMDKDFNEYSNARLEVALKHHAANPLTELNRGIMADIRAFTGGIPQSDDITMLALRYL